MVREVKRRSHPVKRQGEKVLSKTTAARLPFTKINYIIFITAILFLIIGYIFLSIGPVNGVWSLTIAPIVLLFGYIVLIPLAILYKRKPKQDQTQPGEAPHKINP